MSMATKIRPRPRDAKNFAFATSNVMASNERNEIEPKWGEIINEKGEKVKALIDSSDAEWERFLG